MSRLIQNTCQINYMAGTMKFELTWSLPSLIHSLASLWPSHVRYFFFASSTTNFFPLQIITHVLFLSNWPTQTQAFSILLVACTCEEMGLLKSKCKFLKLSFLKIFLLYQMNQLFGFSKLHNCERIEFLCVD